MPALEQYVSKGARVPLSRLPGWLNVLQEGMGHEPFVLEAHRGERTVGVLFLANVRSLLFGRFLVSLPYINTAGVLADDDLAAKALIDRAVTLADELRVRYLELRHEWAHEHPALGHRRTDKVHMRLELPTTGAALWEQLTAKVRNQVKKGISAKFTVHWGGADLLDPFYDVFSRNMRDLGTPTYSRAFFAAIIQQFPDTAELCVVRDAGKPIAGALLLHGRGVSEVPSASSLREYRKSNANMWMYWNLLERSAERRQEVFDFGRSTIDGPTFQFKKQWGAAPCLAEWQYHVRTGAIDHVRPDNPKYKWKIAIWRKLPVAVTRRLGPMIIRGIP